MNKLYMMIGLPASGKSTIAKEISKKENAIIISTDNLRQELLKDVNLQECNEIIFKEAEKRLKEHLNANKDVIFDATNINYKKRRDWLNRFNKYKVRKIAILVATPYEECVERNLIRAKKVPEEVINRMYQSFYVPQYFEGFDEIQIRYNSDYVFKFKDLQDIEQENSFHSLSVLEHCKKVLDILYVKKENDLPYLNELEHAGLLHDIGKLKTKSFKNSRGEITKEAHFYNHEKISAYDSLFEGSNRHNVIIGCTKDVLYTLKLIQWHMILHFDWNEKTKNKYKRMLGSSFWKDLEKLHKADCEAR